MQMHDRGASLRRAERALRDLLGRDGQMRRHRRRMDRAGDGATDDDFALGHRRSSVLVKTWRPARPNFFASSRDVRAARRRSARARVRDGRGRAGPRRQTRSTTMSVSKRPSDIGPEACTRRDDAADPALRRRGGERDDAQAAGGPNAAREIRGAAGARHQPVRARIRRRPDRTRSTSSAELRAIGVSTCAQVAERWVCETGSKR